MMMTKATMNKLNGVSGIDIKPLLAFNYTYTIILSLVALASIVFQCIYINQKLECSDASFDAAYHTYQ